MQMLTIDTGIAFTGAPYIMYEQFQLDNNFKTYLERRMQSKQGIRTEIKPTPNQKSFELVSSTETHVVNFTGSNKQFYFFVISLLYNKSDQHRNIYNSYNAESAHTKMKSITLENASNISSTFNNVKFNTSDLHDKFLLHNQFMAWYCKGCSNAPLYDYANNPVFQESPTRSEYVTSAHEKIFIDLRRGKGYTNEIENMNRDDSELTITIQFKVPAEKKMRLRATGYYQDDYLYSIKSRGMAHYELQRIWSK